MNKTPPNGKECEIKQYHLTKKLMKYYDIYPASIDDILRDYPTWYGQPLQKTLVANLIDKENVFIVCLNIVQQLSIDTLNFLLQNL